MSGAIPVLPLYALISRTRTTRTAATATALTPSQHTDTTTSVLALGSTVPAPEHWGPDVLLN
jgi:hypothetical protein